MEGRFSFEDEGKLASASIGFSYSSACNPCNDWLRLVELRDLVRSQCIWSNAPRLYLGLVETNYAKVSENVEAYLQERQ